MVDDFCDAEEILNELGLLEMELGIIVRKLMRRDIYAEERIERVLRQERLREVSEVTCGRLCAM